MKSKILVTIAFFLSMLLPILLVEPARTNTVGDIDFSLPNQLKPSSSQTYIQLNLAPKLGCTIQPSYRSSLPATLTSTPIALSRFRKASVLTTTPSKTTNSRATNVSKISTPTSANSKKPSFTPFTPKEIVALASPSNYGDRFLKDLSGKNLNNAPIIVLHETVGSTSSVIDFFQTYHADEDEQASYHTMISLDGTIVYFVPPDKRAFGAGTSIFLGALGAESVQTNPRLSGSVNNFAYHIALETPSDGMNNDDRHSGYTNAQYQSLAWLVAKTGVKFDRITTHRSVDRSGSRIDPRSFDFKTFQKLLSTYPRTQEIAIGCR